LNNQVSIIGCGWLGFPLAKELVKKGYKVKGTTTSKDKIALLANEQIDAFHLQVSSDSVVGDIEKSLFQSDVLVLNIPPGLRKNPKSNYVGQIKNLIPYIVTSQIKKVLFISSTSVYKDEESFPEITEDTKANPDSESGKQLLKTEELLLNQPHFKTTVLRFAGLIGNGRHPAKQLSGKTNLGNAVAPVNLIHLEDCLEIIQKIIESDVFGEIFNASTEPHPSKKSYYTSVCKSMNLPLPNYNLTKISKGKIIHSNKLKKLLNYQFQIKLQ